MFLKSIWACFLKKKVFDSYQMGNLTFYLKHINIEYEKIGAKK